MTEHEAVLVVGDVAQEDHRGDRPDRFPAVGREIRVRCEDVDVECPEVPEAVAVEPVRTAAPLLRHRVEAVQRLDIEVGVMAQLVGQGVA